MRGAAAASQSGARRHRVTETPGESRLPSVTAHGRAATMALLLRFVLLCGVAGEWGAIWFLGFQLPAPPWGASCLRPPGNNEAWGRGRVRFGGAAAVVAVRAVLHWGGFAEPGVQTGKVERLGREPCGGVRCRGGRGVGGSRDLAAR